MIRHVQLTNFQNWGRLSLALEQVTVLTGKNGCGKSAFVRALKWAALNAWDGRADAFIRWDTDSASVKFWSGRNVIERVKSPGENFYRLNGRVLKFDTVDRKRPPAEVLKAHGLTLENFQGQRDGAFWFDLTAGQSARALNKIVNLEAIDQSLDLAAEKLRDAKAKEGVCQGRLSAAAETANALAWVEGLDQKLRDLEALETRITQIRARIASAGRSVEKVSLATQTRDRVLALAKRGVELASLGDRMLKLRGGVAELGTSIDGVKSLEEKKCRLDKELSQKRTRLQEILSGTCPLCQRGPTPS